jgi:hypothetical protein
MPLRRPAKGSSMIQISSKPVADYVAATNAFDTEAAVATFLEDAVVNDIQREFAGIAAIRAFTEREVTGNKVTMKPIEGRRHYDGEIITFKIDGAYDKTGLPDPLLLTYYFTLHREKISSLIILLNKPVD